MEMTKGPQNTMDYGDDWPVFRILERADPEHLFDFIASRSGEVRISPTKGKDIICPDCGGRDGHPVSVIDFPNSWWCCFPECFFGKRTCPSQEKERTIGFKEKKFEPLESIPLIYKQACIENLEIGKDVLSSVLKILENSFSLAVFWGDSGRGKTYVACAILNEYKRSGKVSGKFINFSEMYQQWKHDQDTNIFQSLKSVDFLVLDDIGIRAPTEAFLDFFYSILNYRYNNLLKTIITTNLDSKSLTEKFGPQIASRLASGEIIKFSGSDLRIKRGG